MIGIIGYGFVGKAVENAFTRCDSIISDPKYNSITIQDICTASPKAIFVCLPTPSDNSNYSILKGALRQLQESNYAGVIVVKSTILPHHLDEFNVVVNPEFLSRGSANEDFINPPFVLFGGNLQDCEQLNTIYKMYSEVDLTNTKFTDIKTACLAKYTFNSFYATKLTFMNAIYDITQSIGVDYNELKSIIEMQPWIANSHLDVPGHEGRGFAGPCLPKDTEALAKEFNVELLKNVLDLNTLYRTEDKNGSN